MILDDELIEGIESCAVEARIVNVFRGTWPNANPLVMSQSSGRWSIDTVELDGFQVLYTSTTREGAIREVASWRKLLTPVPKAPIVIHSFTLPLHSPVQINLETLGKLGVDTDNYGSRDYSQTQKIALAAHRMDYDGLIVPSARHPSENVVIVDAGYFDRHAEIATTTETVLYESWSKI